MSSSTIPSPDAGAVATRGPRALSRRLSHQLWRTLTPSIEGPLRGRAVEAVRRAMESRLDWQRLRERLPDLAGPPGGRERFIAALLPAYRRFVGSVSPPATTMSLEVAAFLAELCERQRPRRVLELGSGFATAVLRRAGASPVSTVRPEIFTVDDDPVRLDRARSFLTRESLSSERLFAWSEFRQSREDGFDLVVHELDATPSVALEDVMDRVVAGGLLLLDGAHRPDAERVARRALSDAGAEQWSLRAQTRDCYGRHALLARL